MLETLPLEVYREHCELFDEGLYEAIDLRRCVALRTSQGGTSVSSVEAQIASMRQFLHE